MHVWKNEKKSTAYKSNFDIPKSKPFFQVNRYKDLFIPYINNQENINMNVRVNQRNIDVNMNLNQGQINNNNIPNNNLIQPGNNPNNMIIRDSNDMYYDLVRSLFDYMIEIDYHNIGMVVNQNNAQRHKEKAFEFIKSRRNYDSFRVLNVDDQIRIIFESISNDYLEDYAIDN